MLWLMAALAAANLALTPAVAGPGGDPAWQSWQTVAGVFDLGGPRSDGTLVVAGSANLYRADPAGTLSPFARGVGGYHEDPGAEAYLAVSPGARVSAAGCDFNRDDTSESANVEVQEARTAAPSASATRIAIIPCPVPSQKKATAELRLRRMRAGIQLSRMTRNLRRRRR